MRPQITKGFRGCLKGLGTQDVGLSAGSCRPEEHLGCQVWLHGYIADRKELGRRLGLDCARTTNCELLAYAFRKWGHALQAHVLGEYAAVIFDLHGQVALLCHDALGLAPLFYAPGADSLAFATNLPDLADLTASGPVDDEYIADYLAFGYMVDERTPFRSIKRLLPARSLYWAHGQIRHVINWDLSAVSAVQYRNDEEYEEQFRALLEAAVSAALDRGGVTGVGLSGGLDSSSIACVAAAQTGNLAAYSVISPRWPELDEQPWMRSVIEKCGMPWYTLDVDSMLPFSALPRMVHGEPTPAVIGEESIRVQNELLESHGVKVLLSGEGGDSVLCASPGAVPTHLADPLFDWQPMTAFSAIGTWRAGSRSGRSGTFWLLRALVEPTMRHLQGKRAIAQAPLPSWLRPDYVREKRFDRRALRRLTPRCRHPGRQALWHSLWIDAVAMAMIPRQHMKFEYRNPLLYLPLVEFMSAIPWEQKLRPKCDRYLQRRALKGVLPEMVRRRASKSTGNPALVEGLRRSPDWVAYLCDSPMLADRGIVDPERWRLAVRQASVGHTHDDKILLAAIAVETWLKQLGACRAGKLAGSLLA